MEIIDNQLLRFSTAGSVDDGKSTLIGRLLFDSKSIFEDQLESIERTSRRKGHDNIDLAMFTDGLKEEREQGITIDVAYRYFTTPKRKFIIADTPGHIQYTRNMVTGASTANATIILIDARHGVVEQTKRHSYIASLLNIPHVIVCVNKMDLVEYSEQSFNTIVKDYELVASKLINTDVHYIPICALNGDNVVERSSNMSWYNGAPLLHILETLHIGSDLNKIDFRFPVQTILRPQIQDFEDYRGYAGRIASGIVRVGDDVVVLPSGFSSKVKSIEQYGKNINEAYPAMSVSILLEDDLDVSRGDMIVKPNNQPLVSQEFDIMICWLNSAPSRMNAKYTIFHAHNSQKAIIKGFKYKININTLERMESDGQLKMNDIGRATIRTTKPLMIDSYRNNKITGSIILIDDLTNETVAAGMII